MNISTVGVLCASVIVLSACGKPNGISDSKYKTYKELGAPKILFSCTTEERDGENILASMKCIQIADPSDALACSKKVGALTIQVVNVGYTAGVGVDATYNRILGDAKKACGEGEFKVIDSKS